MANTILRDLVQNYFIGVTSHDVKALQNVLTPNGSYAFCQAKELTAKEKRNHTEALSYKKMTKEELIAQTERQAKIDKDSNRFVSTIPEILDVNVQGRVVSVRARHERFDLAATALNDVEYYNHLVELEFNQHKNRICRVDHMLLKTDQRLEVA